MSEEKMKEHRIYKNVMIEQQIEEIVKIILAKQQDLSNKAASDTVSRLFKDLSYKLDTHIARHKEDYENMNKKIDPIHKAFQKASGFKAVLFLIASTVISIVAILEGWRRIFGK